mmetsp:Transcript_52483/g.104227  ORF Transcript_52483/g.104227 Transcript_52483/m.104227 type:complete len:92 (-) Transcript_52483:47-322(-)
MATLRESSGTIACVSAGGAFSSGSAGPRRALAGTTTFGKHPVDSCSSLLQVVLKISVSKRNIRAVLVVSIATTKLKNVHLPSQQQQQRTRS